MKSKILGYILLFLPVFCLPILAEDGFSPSVYLEVDSLGNGGGETGKSGSRSDIIITQPTVWQEGMLIVYGNIYIEPYASLTLDDFCIVMARSNRIVARSNSSFHIYDSTIRSQSTGIYFSMFIEENVDFVMQNSTMERFGQKDPENLVTSTDPDEYAEYGRYLYLGPPFTRDLDISESDGLEVRSTVTSFSSNHFIDYSQIRFYSSNNHIESNVFEDMKHEGLAFMTGSNGNEINDNEFKNATRMNRAIYGLRFYPGTQNQDIY